MANRFLAGVDIGTTGAKTIVFDLTGNAVASGYREYSCVYPKPNWVEQDAQLLVSSAMEASREAITKAGVAPADIASIAFSTQRSCTFFLDRANELVRPMISWQDQRAVAELEQIREKIPTADYYGITGMPLNTTWLLPKIPDGVSYEMASLACCGLGPSFGAMQAMQVSCFDTILITGLGPVGLGAIVNASYRGARIIAVESVPWRVQRAHKMGVEHVLDPFDEGTFGRIMELTGGVGVDCA
jgi:hypothetical protein